MAQAVAQNAHSMASAQGQQPRPMQPSWYNQDEHINERRKMVTSIAKLLQARKPNAPTEWMKKLPQMARRLEESLFRGAPSFDEYKNQDTLKKRLQKLALDMGIRAREANGGANQPAAPGGPASDSNNGPAAVGNNGAAGAAAPGGGGGGAPGPGGAGPPSTQTQEQRQQVLRQQQQRLLLLRHASKCPHGLVFEAQKRWTICFGFFLKIVLLFEIAVAFVCRCPSKNPFAGMWTFPSRMTTTRKAPG